MNRRQVLTSTGAAGAAALLVGTRLEAQTPQAPRPPRAAAQKRGFKLRYAPHPGMFKNHAPRGVVDEIKFAADQGFAAYEFNSLGSKPIEEQERLGREIQNRNMTMGIFVMNPKTGFKQGGTLATGDPAARDAFLDEVRASIEVAKRVNAKWMTSLTGNVDNKLPMGYQFANVVDCLRRASELLEPHGLVMVYEPLNIYENHPMFFLHTNHWAYALMKSVRSPSCKILYDLYHSQIGEGHLIYNFDRCFDEIAYIQTGDVPGRQEPGTGEVNYRNVFQHIHEKGYTGVVGMEHGNSKPGKEGELALIKAYRDADNFPVLKKT